MLFCGGLKTVKLSKCHKIVMGQMYQNHWDILTTQNCEKNQSGKPELSPSKAKLPGAAQPPLLVYIYYFDHIQLIVIHSGFRPIVYGSP
jgi:hypothetical protein